MMKKSILQSLTVFCGIAISILLGGCGQKGSHVEDTHPSHRTETATGGKAHHEPIQYRKKDARPAIIKPEFVAANDAKIAGGTKGIGVAIDGESRFYPLYVLQYHQVINDKVGNSAIACSY